MDTPTVAYLADMLMREGYPRAAQRLADFMGAQTAVPTVTVEAEEAAIAAAVSEQKHADEAALAALVGKS